jgi:hypothetical protein
VKSTKKLPMPGADWQRIWLAARRREWNSLAIVPSHPGIDVKRVAERLAATGRVHGERPVSVVDSVGVELSNVGQVIDSVEALSDRGECVLVPVDPVAENPATLAIIRAMSATLLVVRLGESQLATVQHVIDTIGRERVLGSLVLEEPRADEVSSSAVSPITNPAD